MLSSEVQRRRTCHCQSSGLRTIILHSAISDIQAKTIERVWLFVYLAFYDLTINILELLREEKGPDLCFRYGV